MRIGLDVGGTKILAVALDDDGAVIAADRRATGWGAEAVVDGIVGAVDAVADGATIDAIGIGVPGQILPSSGVVRHALNLGIAEFDLARAVEERTGIRPSVDNDVRAAAVGAASRLPSVDTLAYLNLGTGIAAGIVDRGVPWRGGRGAAGEVGHVSIDPAGPVCTCGQVGCIEALAGGASVAERWGRAVAFPVRDVFDEADAGHPVARAVRDDVVRGVAGAVQLLVLSTDVDAVVLGGGVAHLGERLLTPVRAALADAASGSSFLASLRLGARVVPVPDGPPVGAVGAALLRDEPVPAVR